MAARKFCFFVKFTILLCPELQIDLNKIYSFI